MNREIFKKQVKLLTVLVDGCKNTLLLGLFALLPADANFALKCGRQGLSKGV